MWPRRNDGRFELEQHQKDLADLATVDPEFYQFLKKEDADLLHFDIESIPDDDLEQNIHQLPEHLIEIDRSSDDVCNSEKNINQIESFSKMKMINHSAKKLQSK